MDFNYSIYSVFPKYLSIEIQTTLSEYQIEPEEVRIRLGQPVVVRTLGQEYICTHTQITERDISNIIMNATNGAFHASIEKIQNGFLPLSNGCRLGICGEGFVMDQKIYNIRHINSLCLRIAKEQLGCADSMISLCYSAGFHNTIIIGPPGAGKTTFLRECVRKLSESGYYIGVADERGEISGMQQGKFAFQLGNRTDVICGINKQHAAMMLLRTMAPNILAMDEITSARDMPAIMEAVGCGVGLLTTIHGRSISDLNKPSFKRILDSQVFETAIIIEICNNKRKYRMEQLNV